MGWFWADGPHGETRAKSSSLLYDSGGGNRSPPPGCPMHEKSTVSETDTRSASQCPVGSDGDMRVVTSSWLPPGRIGPVTDEKISSSSKGPDSQSTLSRLNPLNYMFRDLSQAPAPSQSQQLPTEREASTIPRGSGDGNWEYPSPQQMYHALLRKGYHDTDITAVESMVSVHNFLNEGAWGEIMEWEKRFAGGLYRGWKLCRQGERNFDKMVKKYGYEKEVEELSPSLVRFHGRPKDMTPKAAWYQVMGRIYPTMFATEPPFDRHDWYVSREKDGKREEIRYVIDYYSGPDDENGEPVFFLDVRPALTATAAAERALRWGCDTWWRASGADVRQQEMLAEKRRERSG